MNRSPAEDRSPEAGAERVPAFAAFTRTPLTPPSNERSWDDDENAAWSLPKSQIADITAGELDVMEPGVLVRVIRCALPEPHPESWDAEIEHQSRETLVRMAARVRNSCRRQGY